MRFSKNNIPTLDFSHIISHISLEYSLSEKQLALWQWANANNNTTFSRGDAVKALKLPPRTVEAIIKKLVDLKRLERLGQGRATKYRVLTKT